MKTALALALGVGLVCGAFAGLAQAGEAAKPITLKLAHEGPMNDQRQKASRRARQDRAAHSRHDPDRPADAGA